MTRALLLGGWLTASAAWAEPSIVRAGHESIRPLGVVLADRREAVRRVTNTGALEVGFIWQVWGVAGVPFWRWNGRYCVFMDERYWPIPQAQAAALLGVGVEAIDPPLGYWLPSGLVGSLALVLIAVLAYVVPKVRRVVAWLKSALARS